MTVGMVAWAIAAGALLTGAASALARLARASGFQERWVWLVALLITVGASWLPTVPEAGRPADGMIEFHAVEVPRSGEVGESAPDGAGGLVGLPVADLLREAATARVPGFRVGWLALSLALLAAMLGVEMAGRRRCAHLPRASVWGYPVHVDERDGPAVSGLLRPTLVFGRRAIELEHDRRRALVTHEIEHVRAGDVRLLALAWLGVALAPWNPWTWILARRVALAAEADCDRRTLRRRRTSPEAYAELLLEVAGWRARRPAPGLRLAMGRDARGLLERLELLLPERRSRRAAPALFLLLVVLMVTPLLADPPRMAGGDPDPTTAADAAPPPLGPGGVYTATIRERPDTIDTLAAPDTIRATASSDPAGDLDPAGLLRPLGVSSTEPLLLRLNAAPTGASAGVEGHGAFTIRIGPDGGAAGIDTELVSGPAFEASAREWLDAGEYAAPDGRLHVWVAVRDGRWTATPVAADLYARRALDGDPARLRSALDTWSRLELGAPSVVLGAVATFVADSSGVGR